MKLKPYSATFPCRHLLPAAALCLGLAGAAAAAITSADFSFGYRYDGDVSATWTLTTGATVPNTPTTQGDFTFTPSVVNTAKFSGSGPLFTDRTLINGVSGSEVARHDTGFAVSIAAAYTGAEPVTDITIEITEIRIWALRHSSFSGDGQIQWVETTPGHAAASSEFNLGTATTAVTDASLYTDVFWDPTDFAVAGTTATRSFALDADAARPIDGLEIFGRVIVVPEPSTTGLLGIVGMMALLRRRRTVR